MINQGMLIPIMQSDWATPAHFVRKNNGKITVVGDYKNTVNPEIKDSEYPTPTVSEAFATLNGGKIFSQIVLQNAYKQLRVDDQTSEILTISTRIGLFRVTRFLDGLTAAPRIFQNFMTKILQGIQGVQIYIDDIKIQGRSKEEHDKRIKEVLKRLHEANLKINVEKSVFSVKTMDFLGHTSSEEGISPIKNKLKAIEQIPVPKDKKDLQITIKNGNGETRSNEPSQT
ncbi:uncharacterized protein K02A2.6-like [Diprion similis]|uniref:uncharacterized protein K02A2.6-like n=1 Tax=Diprion similis TaxID=362088 RepID=UPI001EF8A036|nr:uncharacterized protein K02A2.6-like [Diprion similis]